MTAYETLIALAEELGLANAAEQLTTTLDEEEEEEEPARHS